MEKNVIKKLLRYIMDQDIGNLETELKELFFEGFELNQDLGDGRKLIHLIVDSFDPNLTVLKFIASYDIDLNALDQEGNSPFLLACRKGGLDKVKYLEEQGAEITSKNINGDDALMMAAYGGHLDILKFLYQKEIFSFDSVNLEDKTPLDIAQSKGHIDIVEFLIEIYEKLKENQ